MTNTNEMVNGLVMVNGQATMDSREVAEMVGKRHDHLLRDIVAYIEVLSGSPDLGSETFFMESSFENRGKIYPCYNLTKQGCEFIANKMTGRKGILFSASYISRFNKMEEKLKKQSVPSYMISDEIERAEAYIREQRQIRLLLSQKDEIIAIQAPKVEYADTVLNSKGTMNITQIAKEFGMSGQAMNKLLKGMDIQWYTGGQWVLKSEYENKNYVDVQTHVYTNSKGETDTKRMTKWTEAGKKFIHEKLKEVGILPVNQRAKLVNFG